LYFFQALLAALVAAFCTLWLLLVTFVYPIDVRYAYLGPLFLALLIVALFVEFLAFLGPLWSFHVIMRTQKAALLTEADRLSQRIVTSKKQLAEGRTGEEQNSVVTPLAADANGSRQERVPGPDMIA